MKKNTLTILLFALVVSFAQAQLQYKIQFSYDSAGNQTLKDKVCVNCTTSLKANDSTLVANLEEESEPLKDKIEESGNSAVFAYPNPVTNLLRVEWVETDNPVQRVVLFSTGGQQLLDTQIHTSQLGVDLSFSQYPPGNYIVVVFYADKTRQSFQVIKK
ncbi:T9SS type A sorting domain-containing protein [Maribacter sp. 2304DJ31-5]|uniref:T9SS type A sorting domain-containing protein n=1 Tax=Maribacter sp. 2304DJ31-5 TaxID=3386273 RepID=UPI0039BC9647